MFQKPFSISVRNFSLVILLTCSGSVFADQDYSAGLSAFIGGDYELAQAHWIKSAKNENYRAMFNLGLLHDQEKIANAEPEKAQRWFQLAGKGGYAAADYHHATRLIEKNADPQQIQALLERAARNGYHPAKAKLGSMTGKQLAVTPSNAAVQPVADATVRSAYLGKTWLMEQSNTDWTIQLLAFQDEAKVQEFIDTHRLHDQAAYFVDASDSEVLFKLVYGSFVSKEAADQARGKLTPALQEYGPWLRTLASVKNLIKK